MSAIRQDAWTDDEDLLLAETVLRHIREGSTQLAAFEEVGKTLSRTPAACGFRWNSLIRKRYENAISLAKKQRKELSKKNKDGNKKRRPYVKVVEMPVEGKEEGLDLQTVIRFLQQLEETKAANRSEQKEATALAHQVATLQQQNQELLRENRQLKKDFSVIKEDYQSLIHIMDRARRFTTSVAPSNEEDTNWIEVTEALTVQKKD